MVVGVEAEVEVEVEVAHNNSSDDGGGDVCVSSFHASAYAHGFHSPRFRYLQLKHKVFLYKKNLDNYSATICAGIRITIN